MPGKILRTVALGPQELWHYATPKSPETSTNIYKIQIPPKMRESASLQLSAFT
jgi:hypothetical protein